MPTDGRAAASPSQVHGPLGSTSPSSPTRACLYCLVDPRASGPLLAAVRDHFASAPQVTVLVERRGTPSEPRPAGPLRPPVRRAPVAERDAGRLLPPRLRDDVDGVRLVQPLAPLRRVLEDVDLPDLVARTVALDPDATSELWWRIAPRVLARLELCLRLVVTPSTTRTVFGRILDELPSYEPARDPLPAWLDAVVDHYAAEQAAAAPLSVAARTPSDASRPAPG